MKKQFILLSTLCSLGLMAQHQECGFEHYAHQNKDFIQKQPLSTFSDKTLIANENDKEIKPFHYQFFSNQNFTPYSGPI